MKNGFIALALLLLGFLAGRMKSITAGELKLSYILGGVGAEERGKLKMMKDMKCVGAIFYVDPATGKRSIGINPKFVAPPSCKP